PIRTNFHDHLPLPTCVVNLICEAIYARAGTGPFPVPAQFPLWGRSAIHCAAVGVAKKVTFGMHKIGKKSAGRYLAALICISAATAFGGTSTWSGTSSQNWS